MATLLLRSPATRELTKRIIFTDEKTFKNSPAGNVEYCNRLTGQAYESNKIQFTKSGSALSDVNIWSYIGPFGKGIILLIIFINLF